MKKLLDYITNRLIEEKCQKLFFVLFMAFFVFVAFYSALTSFKGFFVDTIEHIHSLGWSAKVSSRIKIFSSIITFCYGFCLLR